MNQKNISTPTPTQNSNRGAVEEQGIKVNGMEQVIEMLRYADPQFRESLIRRLGQRDPNLATQLRRLFR